ncbi:phosphonate C-P lyase system protein PhnG [Aureimonas mangrovi]|uniref:phosphonate C-P lyase system protein PhnG n=1 Tax=Aureimonas mangrovi TaxID=2758041 RepID=UPI001FE63C98|nr:phosphonate C-P lyase system protein PhnG [Aureimonas mangrovi]
MSATQTHTNDDDRADRRRKMLGTLTIMPVAAMAERYAALGALPQALPVRGPEIGLVMLNGRMGGGGAPFKLGEASVTRATVRIESGEIGQAMVLGRETHKAQMIAHLDALWQHDDWRGIVEREVVVPAMEIEEAAVRDRAEETAATRVDFFTLARGED